jgi:UDPglucose--hexose-1-phosphate uridylyltransferase
MPSRNTTSAHRRYNPLLDEWVLCSPGRLSRPWLGAREAEPRAAAPEHDPDCYMCPGNERASGIRTPRYRGVYVFDNDYPALRQEAGPAQHEGPAEITHPLLVSAPERGRCRVVCFSERHDRHLGSMSPEEVRLVVDTWASESERLGAAGARYVQIFENRGAMMGASNPHPHGQIWAGEHVPSIPARMAGRLEAHRRSCGRDLLGDYLDEELRRGERIVEAGEHWVQVVPFWAVWPFETLVIPRRLVGTLRDLADGEREELAGILGRLVRRYDALFGVPFPYSMGWYERPRDGEGHEGLRLHARYLPPLLRSASVRKFLVGYELTAEPQRDLTPEEAAERLRVVPRLPVFPEAT